MGEYSLVTVITTVFIMLCLVVFVPSAVQYQIDLSNCNGEIDGHKLETKGDYWDHFYGREVCYVHYNDTDVPVNQFEEVLT